jgi:hypothetical protein
MTKLEKKLLIKILDLAQSEFANHGCNDFDLIANGGLTPEEAKEFQLSLVNDNIIDTDDFLDSEYTMDWLIMAWLKNRIKKEL